jgi:hypothetical protein
MKNMLLLFFFISICQATDIENYFGKYEAVFPNKAIQFTFNIHGIDNLIINGKPVKTEIKYDVLGIYESTLFLKIKINGKNGEFGVINILILKDKEFIIASGFFIWSKVLLNDEYKVQKKFAFSLKYSSIE